MNNESSANFLEGRLATLYGINSMALKALDLVKREMCVERGFARDNGESYYIHCIEVANTLISFGIKGEDVICAALLHDIIEDVGGYCENTISNIFGEKVAKLVVLLTKKKGIDYKEEEAMNEYLSIIILNREASAIKTADRMHNMQTLEGKTFEKRYSKAMETKKYYLPFFKNCRHIYPRYQNIFWAAETQISPLIFNIESFYKKILEQQAEIDKLKKLIHE